MWRDDQVENPRSRTSAAVAPQQTGSPGAVTGAVQTANRVSGPVQRRSPRTSQARLFGVPAATADAGRQSAAQAVSASEQQFSVMNSSNACICAMSGL